jgi:peptidoglycan hydrolase-like protein with peptidoglycan-binding domain
LFHRKVVRKLPGGSAIVAETLAIPDERSAVAQSSKVPADCVWGQDNVSVSLLDPGFKVYAGYWNGPFANMTALKKRFPHAYLISIAIRVAGSKGSVAVDVEPGTLSGSQSGSFAGCLAWLRQGGFGGSKPLIYVMASWARDLEHFLTASGVPRSTYYLWTAHYSGQHLCSPSGCGYGASAADATQYASGTNDYNVFRGYVVGGSAPVPVIVYPTLGSTGPEVILIQEELNHWAKYVGYGPLIVDGVFGGKTYNAVRMFQGFKKITVDGVVGPQTASALASSPGIIPIVKPKPKPKPPTVPSGNPVLKLGDVGQQTAAMQYYLRNSGIHGVRGIGADGSFGPQTQTAVKNFQAHSHLTSDGVYGPSTARALAKVAVH